MFLTHTSMDKNGAIPKNRTANIANFFKYQNEKRAPIEKVWARAV